MHGYGLKSIKFIVNKYNGNLKINIDEDVFTLGILLPMDKNNKWLLLLVVIFFTGYGMYSTKYDRNKAFSKRFHLKYFWSFW